MTHFCDLQYMAEHQRLLFTSQYEEIHCSSCEELEEERELDGEELDEHDEHDELGLHNADLAKLGVQMNCE